MNKTRFEIKSYIKTARPKHCIKNILILLPIFFNGSLFKREKLFSVFLGFLAFSLIASAVYILNDIQDAPRDRLHPVKRNRPIASGAVSQREGSALLAACIALSCVLNFFASRDPGSYACLFIYFLLNVLYSNGLKNVPVLDIVILTSGFVLRLIYGGVISDVRISGWLYLTVIAASFYMGLGKRRNELDKSGGSATRKVLQFYNHAFLDKNMYMCLGMAEVFYALWAIGKKMNLMIWTVPVVIILGMKYSLDIEGDSDGDPVEVIAHDKVLWILSLIYVAIVVIAIYF